MEVINVWSRGVSTSWHGCAPPVVTEWSERQDSNGDDGGKNVTTADMFLHNWDTVEVKSTQLTPQNNSGALVVTLRLRPNALVIILKGGGKKPMSQAGGTVAPRTAEAL